MTAPFGKTFYFHISPLFPIHLQLIQLSKKKAQFQ